MAAEDLRELALRREPVGQGVPHAVPDAADHVAAALAEDRHGCPLPLGGLLRPALHVAVLPLQGLHYPVALSLLVVVPYLSPVPVDPYRHHVVVNPLDVAVAEHHPRLAAVAELLHHLLDERRDAGLVDPVALRRVDGHLEGYVLQFPYRLPLPLLEHPVHHVEVVGPDVRRAQHRGHAGADLVLVVAQRPGHGGRRLVYLHYHSPKS